MLKPRYLFLSAIEGACVMAAEIVSAKLMAPLYGGSLFIWSAILALTLGGLALGYFFGGLLSTKQHPQNQLRRILLMAACCMVCMPFIGQYVLPHLSYLNLWVGIISSALLLVVPPLFFLGASSPLFISLQTKELAHSGKVGGTVYAVSTVGGIVASLGCGFYFIPEWGLQNTILCFALLLSLSTVWLLGIAKHHAGVVLILGLSVWLITMRYQPSKNTRYYKAGILGECEVKDHQNAQGKTIRQLLINQIIQTEMCVDDSSIVTDYLKQLDTLILVQSKKKALVLGLGGGLSASLLQKKGYEVDGVELDERIMECAYQWFYLSPTVNVWQDDARHYLNTCKKKYDLILVDVFKAEEQPAHVLTLQSLERLNQKNLKPQAQLWINWHGYVNGITGRGTRILLQTLHEAGFNTQLYALPLPEANRNLLVKATKANRQEINTLTHLNEAIHTDDKPCLEMANAQANKNWRENYLRYYQGKK